MARNPRSLAPAVRDSAGGPVVVASAAGARGHRAQLARRHRVLPMFAFVAAAGLLGVLVLTPYQATEADAATVRVQVKGQPQKLAAASAATVAVTRDSYKVTPKPVVVKAAVIGAPAVGVPDPGTAQAIGYELVKARGWGDDQYACLVSLFNRESHWNVYAANASGAYGIPQALPGSKMASAGADWATNPRTQITWGLNYIQGRYLTPCGAWGHSQSSGWY